MGVNVEIEDDTPKLYELLHSPIIYDHIYYAQQLLHGMTMFARSQAGNIGLQSIDSRANMTAKTFCEDQMMQGDVTMGMEECQKKLLYFCEVREGIQRLGIGGILFSFPL